MTLPELYSRFISTITSKEIFYDWESINVWLFQQIYAIRGATYDVVMQQVSDASRYALFPYYVVALVVYIVLAYLIMKLRGKGGSKQFLTIWFGIITVLLIGFAVNGWLIHLLKEHFAYPRPYTALSGVTLLDKHVMEAEEANRSFPSGHVAFITLLVMSLWPAFSGRMSFIGLCLIGLVAWSRVSLGAHFPADTFYAFLITALVVIIVREIMYGIYRKVFGINC